MTPIFLGVQHFSFQNAYAKQNNKFGDFCNTKMRLSMHRSSVVSVRERLKLK